MATRLFLFVSLLIVLDASSAQTIATSNTTATPIPTPTAPNSSSNNNIDHQSSSSIPISVLPPNPTIESLMPSFASAASDSSTFQLVANVSYSDNAAERIHQLYYNNQNLFRTWIDETKYDIFPFSEMCPAASQATAIATSQACFAISMGVMQTKFSQCDVRGLSSKSAIKTLLTTSNDILNDWQQSQEGEGDRFKDLVLWRRDVNLAQTVNVPCNAGFQAYAQLTTKLQQSMVSSVVDLQTGPTIKMPLDFLTGSEEHSEFTQDTSLASSTSGSTKNNSTNMTALSDTTALEHEEATDLSSLLRFVALASAAAWLW